MQGRVLIIAGSDPSGGAGVQADIKTVTALGGYAASAITALTVQNTKGVTEVHAVAPDIIRAQIEAVMSDIGADAVKIGMIGEVAVVDLLAEMLAPFAEEIPIILDPVLIATSGDALAGDGVAAAILERLVPLAELVTPNIDEAEALTGLIVQNRKDMIEAGQKLRNAGAEAALVKGGHMPGKKVSDVLVRGEGALWFENRRIDTTSTHGTGCTLASAAATGYAQGLSRADAVACAVRYVHVAIATAPGFGGGAGPLNHTHTVSPTRR